MFLSTYTVWVSIIGIMWIGPNKPVQGLEAKLQGACPQIPVVFELFGSGADARFLWSPSPRLVITYTYQNAIHLTRVA
jgi:hypothetical protein